VRRYLVSRIRPGMILGQHLYTYLGGRRALLLGAGIEITTPILKKLKELGYLSVYIREHGTEQIVPENLLSDETRDRAMSEISRFYEQIRVSVSDLTKRYQTPLYTLREEKIRITPPSPAPLKECVKEIVHDVFLFGKNSGYDTIIGIPHNNAVHNHVLNVAIISILLGGEYSFFGTELAELGMGAILHDIGKAAVPELYTKQYWQLSVDEVDLYKKHPVLGDMLLNKSRSFSEIERQMIMQHHERQDGQGFPTRLKGENKPPLKEKFILPNTIFRFAEIIAVADMYDNLVSGNYYNKWFSPEQALAEIGREAGTGLNASIVDALSVLVTKYPVGSNVRVLMHPNEDIMGYYGVVAEADSRESQKVRVVLVQDSYGSSIEPRSIDIDVSSETDVDLQVVI